MIGSELRLGPEAAPSLERPRASMCVPEPEDERFVTRVAAELAQARARGLELLAPPTVS